MRFMNMNLLRLSSVELRWILRTAWLDSTGIAHSVPGSFGLLLKRNIFRFMITSSDFMESESHNKAINLTYAKTKFFKKQFLIKCYSIVIYFSIGWWFYRVLVTGISDNIFHLLAVSSDCLPISLWSYSFPWW